MSQSNRGSVSSRSGVGNALSGYPITPSGPGPDHDPLVFLRSRSAIDQANSQYPRQEEREKAGASVYDNNANNPPDDRGGGGGDDVAYEDQRGGIYYQPLDQRDISYPPPPPPDPRYSPRATYGGSAGGVPRDYSLQSAQRDSQMERMHENDLWKPTVDYVDLNVSPWNWLHAMTIIGLVWAFVVSLTAWIALVGGWEPTNQSRYDYSVPLWIISAIWAGLTLLSILCYFYRNKLLTYRHNLTVILPLIGIAVILFFGLLALELANNEYTDIRDLDTDESSETSSEEASEALELTNDKHWCQQKKIKAAISYYNSLSWLSLVFVLALVYVVPAHTAHRFPECNSDVTNFFRAKRDISIKKSQKYGLMPNSDLYV